MRSFLLGIALLIGISSCQQINSRQSVRINDEVIVHQKKLMSVLDTYVEALENKEATAIMESLQSLELVANEGISALKTMTNPKCDDQFIDAAETMFQYYSSASKNEYQTIGNFYAIDSISYEEYDSLQILVKDFKENQRKANSAFMASQKTFAKNCGFKLVQDVE